MSQVFFSPLCLRCASFAVNATLFCDICWRSKIEPRLNRDSESHIEGHRYLFDWGTEDPEYWKQFVYRMKSDRSLAAWNFYSNLMAKRIGCDEDEAVAPIPGSKKTSVHSTLLAQQISCKTGRPYVDNLLLRNDGRQQKHRSLYARRVERPFSLNPQALEEITMSERKSGRTHRRILLVDDILTSGSSYKHCRELLKPYCSAGIATLFYRRGHGR